MKFHETSEIILNFEYLWNFLPLPSAEGHFEHQKLNLTTP